MESSGIVVVHTGHPPYLDICLATARRHNPNARIVLLGDSSNAGIAGVEHRMLAEYLGGAARFNEAYRHRNTTDEAIVRIWFQRWFGIAELMKRESWKRCVHIDSDILAFADLGAEAARFQDVDMAASCRSGHCAIINSVSAVEELCVLIERTQKDESLEARMKTLYDERLRECGSGGIDDMTAIEVLGEYTNLNIANLCLSKDGAVFDDNLGVSDGFEMLLGEHAPAMLNVKDVRFRQGIPYVRRLGTGEETRFATLHFQGRKKRFMAACAAGSRLRFESAVRLRLARALAQDAYHHSRSGLTGWLRRKHLLSPKSEAGR